MNENLKSDLEKELEKELENIMENDFLKYEHYVFKCNFYNSKPKPLCDFILDGDSDSGEYKDKQLNIDQMKKYKKNRNGRGE